MERKKKGFSINMGTSSVLYIFIILALVSFAVLALVSSNTDYRLSKSVADNTKSYYEACNQIEEQLAQADASFKALYDTGISRVGYYEQVGKHLSLACPVSDLQSLCVEVDILYPENEGEGFYEITSWTVITTGNLEYDNSLPVLK